MIANSALGQIILSGRDSDVQRFVNAARITNATQIEAIKYGVSQTKGLGFWNKLLAWYPIIGGTALAHSLNLKNPTLHPTTWVNAPTQDANGVKSNGTTQYGLISTLFPASLGLVGGIATYLRGAQASAAELMGTSDGTDFFLIDQLSATRTCFGKANITSVLEDPSPAGDYQCLRRSTVLLDCIRNGISISSTVTATTVNPFSTHAFALLTLNATGLFNVFSNQYQTQFRFMTGVWTLAEALALYNIIQTMETMLGRNV